MESEKVVHGGRVHAADRFIEPTLVAVQSTTTPLMTEEIFGPVLPVMRVGTVDEAIAFVRSRPKPLALYVFSNDSQNIKTITSRTTAGSMVRLSAPSQGRVAGLTRRARAQCINDALFQYVRLVPSSYRMRRPRPRTDIDDARGSSIRTCRSGGEPPLPPTPMSEVRAGLTPTQQRRAQRERRVPRQGLVRGVLAPEEHLERVRPLRSAPAVPSHVPEARRAEPAGQAHVFVMEG